MPVVYHLIDIGEISGDAIRSLDVTAVKKGVGYHTTARRQLSYTLAHPPGRDIRLVEARTGPGHESIHWHCSPTRLIRFNRQFRRHWRERQPGYMAILGQKGADVRAHPDGR